MLPAGAHPGPPRAIIDQKQSGILLGQEPFFVSCRRLRKQAFDAPSENKKAHNIVVRFAFGRDSVGIDESKNDEMFIKQID